MDHAVPLRFVLVFSIAAVASIGCSGQSGSDVSSDSTDAGDSEIGDVAPAPSPDGGPDGQPDADSIADGKGQGNLGDSAGLNDAEMDAGDTDVPQHDAGPSGPCSGYYPPYAGPTNPYTAVENLRDANLTAALRQMVKANHRSLGYTGAKNALFGALGIDVRDSRVECVYGGALFLSSQLDESNGFNAEHSWPQSEFGSEASVAKADMHHLFPTEQKINSCRSNHEFGDTDQPKAQCSSGGSALGPGIGSGDLVFEVRPAKRGDIARSHLYFSVRYNLRIGPAEEGTLRRWHEQDPPDTQEKTRNDAICLQQSNRNPFVDRPEFVSYVSDF